MCLFLAVLTILIISPASLWNSTASAQERLVERIGSAKVPVYEDNLDVAKRRALLGAQQNALERMIQELVATEWLTLFQSELRRNIISRPDRYIGSYRARRLEASLDRTGYIANVTALINLNQVIRDLRAIPLPVKGDPRKSLRVFYPKGDPALTKTYLRSEIVRLLKERFDLLNFDLKNSLPLEEEMAIMLANPFESPAKRGDFLRRNKTQAGLYLAFQEGSPPTEEDPEGVPPSLEAYLYQAGNGVVLGTFNIQSRLPLTAFQPGKGKYRDAVLKQLVNPLINQLQPGGIKALGLERGGKTPLKLRVVGFHSLDDEESFEEVFFRKGSAFKDFVLYRIQENAVTYQGTYGGDRMTLEQELSQRMYGDFRISNVYWFNEILEFEVERVVLESHVEMKLFPPELHPPQVAQSYQHFQKEFPDLEIDPPIYDEVEDNGWLNRANTIPFGNILHGFIDSRADVDVFVGEELKENETLDISWYRMGRTNLSPQIRIYDAQSQPVRILRPRNFVNFKYKVPKGQHRIYIQVGDRFGGLPWDSGGYLSFNYIFKVERTGTD